MSASVCKACGNRFHKGRRRFVLLPDGSLVSALVCPTCANGRTMQVVPQTRKNPCSLCSSTAKRDATMCSTCANNIAHVAVSNALAPFAAHLHKLAKAYRLDSNELHSGLTMAAEILDEARAVTVRAEPEDGPSNGLGPKVIA